MTKMVEAFKKTVGYVDKNITYFEGLIELGYSEKEAEVITETKCPLHIFPLRTAPCDFSFEKERIGSRKQCRCLFARKRVECQKCWDKKMAPINKIKL